MQVSPRGPDVLAVVQGPAVTQEVWHWRPGGGRGRTEIALPEDTSIHSLAWHPDGKTVFFAARRGERHAILRSAFPAKGWSPSTILDTDRSLGNLIAGPEPFETRSRSGEWIERYRLFFGVARPGDRWAIYSATEEGERIYPVVEETPDTELETWSAPVQPRYQDPPETLRARSAEPVGFHPGGYVMLFRNEKGCHGTAHYGIWNWVGKHGLGLPDSVSCSGGLAYAPNGAAVLHWRPGARGVTLYLTGRNAPVRLLTDTTFLSMPILMADGRGIVGVTEGPKGEKIVYMPVAIPLGDVANAWQFVTSEKEWELFESSSGLFRPLARSEFPADSPPQMYSQYEFNTYPSCRGEPLVEHPNLVTTDLLWDLFSAAFEGLFILVERQAAIPAFVRFVAGAEEHLRRDSPRAEVTQVLAALKAVLVGDSESDKLAAEILADQGEFKPRGHYALDPELGLYFRAAHYFMVLKPTKIDLSPLAKLPDDVQSLARTWIEAYSPFQAPSRRPLIWKGVAYDPPSYLLHPIKLAFTSPLSWGFDNEIMNRAVYHSDWPPEDQVLGPEGPRLLPSGTDIAMALGSPVAARYLEQSGEFLRYPVLPGKLKALRKNFKEHREGRKRPGSLYERWIDSLALQWAEDVVSPGRTFSSSLWHAKRLQTGLASWTMLRHATLLINERSAAEAGEGGFEAILLTPPKGYVEPDPRAFNAIGDLFDATASWFKSAGGKWTGVLPSEPYANEKEALREGVIRRLTEARNLAARFADIAQKEIDARPLTEDEFILIRAVGGWIEHDHLVFRSLSRKDLGLGEPGPLPRVADVADSGERPPRYLHAAVGNPLVWDQIVPFFGRRQIASGSIYSYYELVSAELLDDSEWLGNVDGQPRPPWLRPFVHDRPHTCLP